MEGIPILYRNRVLPLKLPRNSLVILLKKKTSLLCSGFFSDVHKKIKAAFEAFDYQSNNTVDVRSVINRLRSCLSIKGSI